MGDRAEKAGAARENAGQMLLLVSAFAFSTAGLFTRMAPVGVWPMVFWRNAFGCVGLAAVLLVRHRPHAGSLRPMPLRGWMAMVCSAFGTVCYLAAFALTSVTDIAIIYATAPMLTAALAWLSFGERPARRTLVAAAVALLGVIVTVAGSPTRGSITGDALALLMTAALSIVAVLVRGADLPPLATAFGSSALAAIAVLPPALTSGLGVGLHDMLWLAAFGVVTMTIALPAYLAGAARVPAGRAMLISASELPLAPLWVWLVCGEMPSHAALVGGILVMAAVLWDLTA